MNFWAFIMSLKAMGMTAAQITAAVNQYLQDHPDALDQAAVEAILDGRLDVIDGELDQLRSVTNQTGHDLAYVARKNLFDKNNALNETGKYYNTSGTLTGGNANNAHTHPIFVTPGDYTFYTYKDNFGENNAKVVIKVNAAGEKITPTAIISTSYLDSTKLFAKFTVTEACYITYNYNPNGQTVIAPSDEIMYVDSTGVAPLAEKTELEALYSDLYRYIDRGGNLFNKDDARNTSGQYYTISPWKLVTGSSSSYWTSHPILLFPGTYKYNGSSSFGTSNKIVTIVDPNGNPMNRVGATYDSSTYIVEFTVAKMCYISINFTSTSKASLVLCKSSEWTGTYKPYSAPKISYDALALTGKVEEKDTSFFDTVAGTNLFDKDDSTDWVEGKYFKSNDPERGSLVTYTNYKIVSGYVPLNGPGTYCLPIPRLYGNSGSNVNLYNSNKEYVTYSSGTKAGEIVTISVTQTQIENGAAYIGLTWVKGTEPVLMVVKAATYPTYYVPHETQYEVPDVGDLSNAVSNNLYKKQILFDGDSIFDEINSGSFSTIIAAKNKMGVHNFAVSGGTLTLGVGSSDKHRVSWNVDTMYSLYPNADYIIFEGGTNDADLIGSIIGGSTPAQFGSFDPDDFTGPFDAETFCGAVETIISKAMTYWTHKKIGFVIAMKMGTNINTYKNRRAYFNKIIEICTKWGMPYLDLWNGSPMNPMLTACYDSSMTASENAAAGKLYQDGQHPTKYGLERLSPIIEAWLRTL